MNNRFAIPTIAVLFAAAVPAQKHPHFDDGGALSWHQSLNKARIAATKADKIILIEYGRAA